MLHVRVVAAAQPALEAVAVPVKEEPGTGAVGKEGTETSESVASAAQQNESVSQAAPTRSRRSARAVVRTVLRGAHGTDVLKHHFAAFNKSDTFMSRHHLDWTTCVQIVGDCGRCGIWHVQVKQEPQDDATSAPDAAVAGKTTRRAASTGTHGPH